MRKPRTRVRGTPCEETLELRSNGRCSQRLQNGTPEPQFVLANRGQTGAGGAISQTGAIHLSNRGHPSMVECRKSLFHRCLHRRIRGVLSRKMLAMEGRSAELRIDDPCPFRPASQSVLPGVHPWLKTISILCLSKGD
jgi:hypothetical protein